ncbi:hypothetical protein D3C79_1067200 [compost metagenome]
MVIGTNSTPSAKTGNPTVPANAYRASNGYITSSTTLPVSAIVMTIRTVRATPAASSF